MCTSCIFSILSLHHQFSLHLCPVVRTCWAMSPSRKVNPWSWWSQSSLHTYSFKNDKQSTMFAFIPQTRQWYCLRKVDQKRLICSSGESPRNQDSGTVRGMVGDHIEGRWQSSIRASISGFLDSVFPRLAVAAGLWKGCQATARGPSPLVVPT